ncbi:hypothetical protein FS837_012642 [Tulasnella sp. UAMH 9824]|nr:hypothetical protein FS837_012642 [Tulasnella sp. UAMH 9824]
MDKQIPVFIKYLPFPGKSETASDATWEAWREQALKAAKIGDPIELLEAARCIAHLHGQDTPIVHGGIHPTQILVGNQRRPRLFDFGIVSIIASLDPPPSQATVTPSNPRGGYYAPELLERGTATPSTDVYAFAGVMLSVMTGSHPHNTHPVPEVAWLSGKPSPSEYPALQEKHPLWALMNRMWEREGSARPNIYQVASSLETLSINESQASKSSPSPTRDLQELQPEDEIMSGTGTHPQIQRLIDEALRVLNPRTLGETAMASDLLKRLDREVAPDIEGELDIVHKDVADGTFSRVSMALWKKPLSSGHFSTITVAVKLLRLRVEGTLAEKRARVHLRLRRESLVWMDLLHENILQFYGFRSGPDEDLLISPWCANGDLYEYLITNQSLDLAIRLNLARQVGSGLVYLHTRTPPITHGDIKPKNVLIGDRLQALICDFGLARAVQDLPTGYTTQAGPGTDAYRAPELWLQSKPSLAGDVYAFGGLVLKCRTFLDPFYGKRKSEISTAIIKDCMVALAADHGLTEVDPFYRFMCWCCQAIPEDRPPISIALGQLERQISDLGCQLSE